MDVLTLGRLRSFLVVLAAWLFAGTMIELVLAGHVKTPVQLTPFALCILGLLTLGAVRIWPGRRSVYALRTVMALAVCGSGIGIAQHFLGNLEFAVETKPGADSLRILLAALTGGDPLLAPGILTVAAAVAIAATYSTSDEVWDEGLGPLGFGSIRRRMTRASADTVQGEPMGPQGAPSI